MNKILPKDTLITTFFEHKDRIFSKTKLPDGRTLLKIVHTWGDGEIMEFGFEYSDGIHRTGLNPLQIIKLYDKEPSPATLINHINSFLLVYYKSTPTTER